MLRGGMQFVLSCLFPKLLPNHGECNVPCVVRPLTPSHTRKRGVRAPPFDHENARAHEYQHRFDRRRCLMSSAVLAARRQARFDSEVATAKAFVTLKARPRRLILINGICEPSFSYEGCCQQLAIAPETAFNL
eukprot:4454615-Pleurochrysis_carterae.AAC.1